MSEAPSSSGPSADDKSGKITALLLRAPWRLIGLVLLVIVLLKVDLRQVGMQFSAIGPLAVVVSASSVAILVLCRCWRWRILNVTIGSRAPLWDVIESCNHSIWLGLLTPGRVGEFRRAVDLSAASSLSLAASSGLVLFDVLMDLGVFVAFAIGGLLYFVLGGLFGTSAWFVAITLAAIGLLNIGDILGLIGRIAPVLLRVPGVSELLPPLRDRLRGKQAWQALMATAASTSACVLMIASLVAPMRLHLDAITIITLVGLAGIAGAVPITYFGLGTREATLIWFLHLHGIGQSDATAVSFTYLLATLIGIAVSISIGALLALARSLGRSRAV